MIETTLKYVTVANAVVPPGFEPGSRESESRVLTN
jgi:hypothetical protein